MDSNDTTLVIKNPSRSNQHFSINFRLDGTIADLQKLLSETYEGRPAPADQTLIYGGKVLKDNSVRLRDIVSKHDAPVGPHSIHLVIKQKPTTIGPSPARSVDSKAAAPASRAGSTVNAGTGTARPIPPPTRTVPAFGSGSASGAGPSTEGNTSSSHPSAEPPFAASGVTSQSDPDDLDAGASFFNSWAPFPGTEAGGLFGAAFGSPFAPVPGTAATDGNPTGQEGAAAAAAAMPAGALSAYMYYNPIIGGAYQAAYSAALAALSVASQQQLPQEQPGHQAKELAAAAPLKDQGDVAASSTGAGAAAELSPPASTAAAATTTTTSVPVAQQYAYVPVFIPAYGQVGYPFGVPGGFYNMPQQVSANSRRNGQQAHASSMWPPMPLGQQWHHAAGGMGFGAEIEGGDLLHLTAFLDALEGRAAAAGGRRPGGRGQEAGMSHAQGGAGGGAARDGLRVRRARLVPLGVMPGNEQPAAEAAARNRAGAPRRPRVFTIRVSARALLQALVFAIVLYQHFTWRRFLALLIGGAVLLITSTWAPFRRLMRGIHEVPQRPAVPPGRGGGPAAGPPAAAAAAAGAAGAAGGPAGPGNGGAQQPAEQQQQQVQRRGFLYEILVFVVGFITSLLPAWNFNPEDAAAFAAGQEVIAADERARQQQQAAGEREAAPAEGAGAGPAQEGAPAAAEAAAPDQ
ncbi:hypothetical protein VOLCADRAFT_103620 [Volvox carteri f. nagariensis]|uniref:Ubiquitin-like domain-containing protein n=1 Tax=Volvox carteri f. nagariensis TaxID=3068 RepID=D8TNE8_VOLCA|nr:uncharacterized protein VOLCADRAFT_103620 [Volvox carteri f. nagariensis]EFJ50980.1 hypothetical protein VOLCADRAFT_103620 [Volvox carteri f. nagariensis]|eukprot:XP_002947992.1 hypothetical protein VOLCADRAFT_103620 [Volvox carteri f. nagariensis]